MEGRQEYDLPTKTKLKKNVGSILPTDRRFCLSTNDLVNQQKIYQPTHENRVSHPSDPS